MLIGIDQDVRIALRMDGAAIRGCERLSAQGWQSSWAVTHVVSDDQDNHIACCLDAEPPAGMDTAQVAAAVLAAVAVAEEHDGHHHEPPATGVWADGATAGDERLANGARAAVEAELAARSSGSGGRAVLFPGAEKLLGTVPVAQITEQSAIERISSMGGPLGDDAELVTRDHVRPLRQDGRWVLHVQPARGGVQVPFEAPVHHACCEDH